MGKYLDAPRTVTIGPGSCDAPDPDEANCTSGPGNEPVSGDAYRRSLLVRRQAVVDRGRAKAHQLGARPYRVFLVWQERDHKRKFREVKRIELMPVKLTAMDAVDLEASLAGLDGDGGVTLTQVSPQQVSEDNLYGWIDGVDWAANNADREFFYEVQRHSRCSGRDPTRRARFVLAARPHYDGAKMQYRVQLVDQDVARDRDGNDQTVAPRPTRPRLVT